MHLYKRVCPFVCRSRSSLNWLFSLCYMEVLLFREVLNVTVTSKGNVIITIIITPKIVSDCRPLFILFCRQPLSHELGIEWASRRAQRSTRVLQAVRGRRTNERCEQMSGRMKAWPWSYCLSSWGGANEIRQRCHLLDPNRHQAIMLLKSASSNYMLLKSASSK